MSLKSENKLIISICSRDVIYCLSVFEPGDVILAHNKAIQNVYFKLGVKANYTRFLFLSVLFSSSTIVYVFGQGPTFKILFFRKLLSKLGKRIFYSDSYQNIESCMIDPDPSITLDAIYKYFPDWLQRFLGIGFFSAGNYYFFHAFTMMEPTIPIIKKFEINCDNSVVILDEILILYPNLLDYKRIASKYKMYLKKKSRKSGFLKVDPSILTWFFEHGDTIVPIELYSDYRAIIGNNSTALFMPKSISVSKIVGEPNHWMAATFIPDTLEELYLYLEC